jgi:eukaryotic-like serine/threonine-protein kinase
LSRELQTGQVLDGRFEITALIERSGMSTIFKALDRHTSQMVVLKVPHAEFEGSSRNSARFAHEARIIAKLDHPGILKVIPVAEKTRAYVVLEYLEGQTLYDILKRRRPLPVCEALELASRLCDILDYIHRQDVVHRDLNPGNILISDDGRPRIIDFGVAKSPGMELSSTAGTPEYMSPEQLQGGRVDTRTDIYSLGMILQEMVTGNEVSEQIEEVILHAMAPNPSDRYASGAAMKADLDFPENVQVTGLYKNPRALSAWPKRMRVACFILAMISSPFVLFYIFLLIFQRQLAR